jgi:hypothetical protein
MALRLAASPQPAICRRRRHALSVPRGHQQRRADARQTRTGRIRAQPAPTARELPLMSKSSCYSGVSETCSHRLQLTGCRQAERAREAILFVMTPSLACPAAMRQCGPHSSNEGAQDDCARNSARGRPPRQCGASCSGREALLPLIKGYFSALRGSWVRSCLRPSFAENRIRWP